LAERTGIDVEGDTRAHSNLDASFSFAENRGVPEGEHVRRERL